MNGLIGILIGTVSLQSLIQHILANSASPEAACNCQTIFQPVCGDNDITYSNICVLNCNSNGNVNVGYPPIKLAYPGECKAQTCFCPAIAQPVCGTDGRTYGNGCELGCYNKRRRQLCLPIIEVAYQGQCRTGPNCKNVIIPVCGSDRRTYRNICYLQYESRQNQLKGLPPIIFISSGPCKQDTCICTLNVDPVCASDGKTYSNICLLDCENRKRKELGQPQLTIVNKGECEVNCICTLEYNPVCGSDGNTYGNPCAFDCENKKRIQQGLPILKIVNSGECEGCFCPQYVDPVCGSDGKSYSNPCYLGCENKKRENQGLPLISIVSQGNCPSVTCVCTKEYDPVCASDKKTYGNPCLLNCENTKRQVQGLPTLSTLYKGECNNSCICPEIYDPVCVTDYSWVWTYGNTCKVECENWRRSSRGLPPLTTLYRGSCVVPCRCNCTSVSEPVCGNDRRTYKNICWLECSNRCNESQGGSPVKLVKYGPC